MFERYTEKARRAIFFSRYEASQFGASSIDTEHLLLGLIREDARLRAELDKSPEARQQIRSQIQVHTPPREKTSTSVDLPFSPAAKLVLLRAGEESKDLNDAWIDCGHLVLGLLHNTNSFCASLLRSYGIQYDSYRDVVRQTGLSPVHLRLRNRPERPAAWIADQDAIVCANALEPAMARFRHLLLSAGEQLENTSESYSEQRLKRKPWSRKQAPSVIL